MANIDERSLYCVLQLVASTWADVALIDKQVLQHNVHFMSACTGGLSL